ncbi:MAG TPA: hypothetical protein PK624_03080 [Spirochaetota bacterium]|nr:hypothetical protein [Spirochaetota bacterium]HOR43760.1 hypothetical protein [Spirochaetota bacterium]HPK55283.1 hypothetical protein [Spirochaetota bacterium]
MKKTAIAFFFLIICSVSPARDSKGIIIAFLPFSNMTGNRNYDYLCELIPNGLTFSFRGANYTAINASSSSKSIRQNFKEDSPINPDRYMEISDLLSSNYLIHGTFNVSASGKSFVIRVYNRNLDEYISFETNGDIETETEIFGLVDKLKKLLSELAGSEYIYKTEKIRSMSRIALFSNLSGKNYNEIVMEFLKSGHKVASLQGNEIRNDYSSQEIGFFYSLSAKQSSIEKTFKHKPKVLVIKPWVSGKDIAEEEAAISLKNKMLYAIKEETIKSVASLSAEYGGLDYIFFINIDENTEKFWLRCINPASGKLIWIESGSVNKDGSKNIYASAVKQIISKYDESTE